MYVTSYQITTEQTVESNDHQYKMAALIRIFCFHFCSVGGSGDVMAMCIYVSKILEQNLTKSRDPFSNSCL